MMNEDASEVLVGSIGAQPPNLTTSCILFNGSSPSPRNRCYVLQPHRSSSLIGLQLTEDATFGMASNINISAGHTLKRMFVIGKVLLLSFSSPPPKSDLFTKNSSSSPSLRFLFVDLGWGSDYMSDDAGYMKLVFKKKSFEVVQSRSTKMLEVSIVEFEQFVEARSPIDLCNMAPYRFIQEDHLPHFCHKEILRRFAELRIKLPAMPIGQALLNHDIFGGNGQIEKMEVLHRAKIHPSEPISNIGDPLMKSMILFLREFMRLFLACQQAKYAHRMDKMAGKYNKQWPPRPDCKLTYVDKNADVGMDPGLEGVGDQFDQHKRRKNCLYCETEIEAVYQFGSSTNVKKRTFFCPDCQQLGGNENQEGFDVNGMTWAKAVENDEKLSATTTTTKSSSSPQQEKKKRASPPPPPPSPPSFSSSISPKKKLKVSVTSWECTYCTFKNTNMDHLACEVCRGERVTLHS